MTPEIEYRGRDDSGLKTEVLRLMIRHRGQVNEPLVDGAIGYLRSTDALNRRVDALYSSDIRKQRKAKRELRRGLRGHLASRLGAGMLSIGLWIEIIYWTIVLLRWFLSRNSRMWALMAMADHRPEASL